MDETTAFFVSVIPVIIIEVILYLLFPKGMTSTHQNEKNEAMQAGRYTEGVRVSHKYYYDYAIRRRHPEYSGPHFIHYSTYEYKDLNGQTRTWKIKTKKYSPPSHIRIYFTRKGKAFTDYNGIDAKSRDFVIGILPLVLWAIFYRIVIAS